MALEQLLRGCAVSWGAARSEFLLVAALLAGCVQTTPPVAQWRQPADQRPQVATSERAYVEAPPPVKFLDPPAPAVKPDDEAGLVTNDPPMVDTVASQRARAGMAGGAAVQPINAGSSTPVKAPQLIGLTEAGMTKLLGQPAETEAFPQSRIWTYRSAVCTLKLFFYSTDAAPDFRALTYQIEERNHTDPGHGACLAGLLRSSLS
jgi:hypothetical protein